MKGVSYIQNTVHEIVFTSMSFIYVPMVLEEEGTPRKETRSSITHAWKHIYIPVTQIPVFFGDVFSHILLPPLSLSSS